MVICGGSFLVDGWIWLRVDIMDEMIEVEVMIFGLNIE